MHRRKSFLFRLFALLFALLLLITASVELALYHYARQVVGQEYIRLNQAGLRQISYTLGQGMTDTQTLAKRIAESTQLIELLSGPAGERADEAAHDLLYSLSSDYVWQRGIKMLMDSYVVGFNGVTAATYSSRQFNYDAVLADPRYEPLFSGTQDALLLPTTTHPEATGIFVHSFQYAQLIRDHLTQEPLGVVILNISEVSLYSQYLRHQSADNRFFLTDGSGTIVSARDKQLIGSIYAYTPEELDALAAETSLSRRIDGGQIRLYERIPGTDWYLVEEMSASAAFGTLNLVRNGAFLATGLCAALILAVLLYAYRQILRPITSSRPAWAGSWRAAWTSASTYAERTNSAVFRRPSTVWWSRSPPFWSRSNGRSGRSIWRSWIFSRPRSTPTSSTIPSAPSASCWRWTRYRRRGRWCSTSPSCCARLSPARWSSSPWGRSWTR